jgi:hypothetical protein
MLRFAKPDSSVFSRCVVRQSVLLDQVQQNQTVQFLKSDGPKFPGLRTNQAKQRWSVLMIEGHPWYVIYRTLVILLIEKFGGKL